MNCNVVTSCIGASDSSGELPRSNCKNVSDGVTRNGSLPQDCSEANEFHGFQFDYMARLSYPLIMPKKGETRYDTCWRKSRIAARILLREEAGKLTPRDVALGRKFAADYEVLPRLIDQAVHGIRGKKFRLERERRAKAR
jgi:hypothetical protein